MSDKIARIAISKATYAIDRPYDYLIPETFADIVPGMRVIVPFSINNYLCEGIVLGFLNKSEFNNLKQIVSVLDPLPIVSLSDIKLALFMRDRFFCTFYDAIKCIAPSIFFADINGKRRVNDATREIASLLISQSEAFDLCSSLKKKAPAQAKILDVLSSFISLSVKDLLLYSKASRSSLLSLEKKCVISINKVEVYRRPYVFCDTVSKLPDLTPSQSKAYDDLVFLVDNKSFSVSLLRGVTGSGKTLIYLYLINRTIKTGKSVILLVPEIALTPQTIDYFSKFFGNEIAVLHSGLSDSQKYDEWKRIQRTEVKLVIGTRSAIFAPVYNLGLVIIDEEQEDSYKSENSPRYNVLDVAKYRCKEASCGLLLGSATPSIESMYNSLNGNYSLVSLNERYNKSSVKVIISDMRDEMIKGNSSNISLVLYDEIKKNLERNEQTILFLNRRGTSKSVSCHSCGYIYTCPNCSVTLTYHGIGERLICHYCGYSRRIDSQCPKCGEKLFYSGIGTQQVVSDINLLFPHVPVIRLDADSVSEFGTHDYIISKFKDEKIPIMIGTQMISKGHNFENVTLVGVLSADQSLFSGDYRSSEKTFSLITQVIGRSGRMHKNGRAVIQTYNPDNPIINFAASQDYLSFYDYELEFRRLQNLPPYSHLYSIISVGRDEDKVFSCAGYIHDCARNAIANKQYCNILGPAPLSIAKLNNNYRVAVYLTSNDLKFTRALISNILVSCSSIKQYRNISVYADSNPF